MRLTLLFAAAAAAFYAADEHVYELTPATFDTVVYGTNYTSIVEFYAPWCGYCKQLEPVWRRLGRYVHGDARYAINVAAVDCAADHNKPLCARHRIQSYPTVMVFRPPKHQRGHATRSKHVGEAYNGQRELVPLADFAKSRVKNYVARFNGPTAAFARWLAHDPHYAKVVLVSPALTNSPLVKSVAIDFLDSADVAHVSAKLPAPALAVDVDGVAVPLPVTDADTSPVLMVWDAARTRFVRYPGKKLNKMKKIEQFIVDQTGAVPREGVLSKRDRKLRRHLGVAKDEL